MFYHQFSLTVAVLSVRKEQEASLRDILQYSLFKSHEELLAEIDAITSVLSSAKTGTRIIIWNLRRSVCRPHTCTHTHKTTNL